MTRTSNDLVQPGLNSTSKEDSTNPILMHGFLNTHEGLITDKPSCTA